MTIGFLVACLPYLGLPHSWQAVISTVLGFMIIGVLLLARRRKSAPASVLPAERAQEGRSLHVERMEVVERPEVHVERETIIDTAQVHENTETETTVEKKVTVLRKRKKKQKPEEVLHDLSQVDIGEPTRSPDSL